MSTSFDKVPKSRLLRPTTQSALPKTKMRLLTAAGKPIESAQTPPPDAAAQQSAQEQAEYERQMAEYNRQMEEYNRQMAQFEQEQAAAAATPPAPEPTPQAVATPEPTPTPEPAPVTVSPAEVPAAALVPSIPDSMVAEAAAPAPAAALEPAGTPAAKPRLQVARPKLQVKSAAGSPLTKTAAAGSQSKATTASPLKKQATAVASPFAPAPANEQSGEETDEAAPARPDYLSSLETNTKPFWKSMPFIIGLSFLVAAGSYSAYTIMQNTANEEARLAHQNAVNALLERAKKINRAGVETLADAREKNVEVVCSMDDAKLLLGVVIDPFVDDEHGTPRYGGNPEGVAQNACLLLGIAAEKDPEIAKYIFTELAENAAKVKPSLLSWLIQRMAVADVKQFNKHLSILAKRVADKPDFNRKDEVLASIWEVKGLRVTERDIPDITKLLKDEKIKPALSGALVTCLINIMDMITDPDKKQDVGDMLFTNLPKSQVNKLIRSLGASKSPKARAYYEGRIQDKKNWRTELRFFTAWGDDSIIPFFKELEAKAETEQEKIQIKRSFQSILIQNRDRDDATLKLLMDECFEKVYEDTSDWDDVLNKTDPDAAAFIGKDAPEYDSLMARRKELEEIRREKLSLIESMAGLNEHDWNIKLLDHFEKDADGDVSYAAKTIRKKIASNTLRQEALRERYQKRTK